VECWIGIEQEEGRRIVRLAGRLGEAQVPEMLKACAQPGPLLLDLSDLLSVDAAGLEALQRVRARGATLAGVPGYIQLQLESTSRMRHGMW
jgi:anti-anti-sigma regulatory factor